MSNSLSSLNSTMVQDAVLPALKLALIPIDTMSVKLVSNRTLTFGETVRVPIASARTAGVFSGNWETGDSTLGTTPVEIIAPKFSSWYVDPVLEGMPTAERFLAQGVEAAFAVAKLVLQTIMEHYVVANIGSGAGDVIQIDAENFDSNDYADLLKLLRDKGVSGQLSAIMDTSYVNGIEKDNAIQYASAYGNNTLITTGEVPAVRGVRSFFTDAFPPDLTNENTGVVFTSSQTVALAIGASGAPTDQEGEAGIRTMVITDPDTGLSMNWRTWVNSGTGRHWGAVWVMMGSSFLRDAAVRVTSA